MISVSAFSTTHAESGKRGRGREKKASTVSAKDINARLNALKKQAAAETTDDAEREWIAKSLDRILQHNSVCEKAPRSESETLALRAEIEPIVRPGKSVGEMRQAAKELEERILDEQVYRLALKAAETSSYRSEKPLPPEEALQRAVKIASEPGLVGRTSLLKFVIEKIRMGGPDIDNETFDKAVAIVRDLPPYVRSTVFEERFGQYEKEAKREDAMKKAVASFVTK